MAKLRTSLPEPITSCPTSTSLILAQETATGDTVNQTLRTAKLIWSCPVIAAHNRRRALLLRRLRSSGTGGSVPTVFAYAGESPARFGTEGGGTEYNQSFLPRSLTTFACLKPPAASQRSHHRSCVMWLRREPNNRSKPTHLKYFSTPQHKSPSESEDFPVLIQPNF
jgi:hypothetical protein